MPYISGEDRDQIILLPECLDDYVNADNAVRVIDAFVETLDLGELGFKAESAVEGRPGYDPRDMLKLYIYGYTNKIRSSRRLQREAGRNVELMWLLRKIAPDFRCIADFRKNNAAAIRNVFRAFVRLCDKAKLLSHETVVIDGSKFRAVNADQKAYVRQNVQVMLQQADERIEKYMQLLDESDEKETRPEALNQEDIRETLEYLNKRKRQLNDAMAQMEGTESNQLCVTDPECRLMKTRNGYKPSYNVQTAVEANNHIIVHYNVTNDYVDWNLLEEGINGAKEALCVETLEGIADKGYAFDEKILACLLNGDTPTTYPNKGSDCRVFHYEKTDDDVTDEMLTAKDHETLKRCLAAGKIPNILKRNDITLEIARRRVDGTYQYENRETGDIVSWREMVSAGGSEREKIDVQRDEPVQAYFERDLEKDIVICPMGQTLYYAGPGSPSGVKDSSIRRYHRAAACKKCKNKCTMGQRRVVGFKPGELQIPTTFYDRCKAGKITKRMNYDFITRNTPPAESKWNEWVTIRFYPNQRKLRKRNQIVEHPYGTVKWWNDSYFLLMKGKLKTSAEMALSFLSYDLGRALKILGTQRLLEIIQT